MNQRHHITTVSLAPGTHVFARDATHVQFGMDATRAGIIETPHAERLAVVLSRLSSPVRVSALIDEITTHTGVHPTQVQVLLDELIDYRILRATERRAIYVVGHSTLARALVGHFTQLGFTVRRPLRSESDGEFLTHCVPTVPLVIVDKLAYSRGLAKHLVQPHRTVIPVNVVDHRVLIGPVRMRGTGACLLCLQLRLTDIDEEWHRITSLFQSGPPRPDPTVISAGVAETSVLLRRAIKADVPAGVTLEPVSGGELIVVDPFGGGTRREAIAQHGQCPACSSETGSGR
ncbi:TOMM precursor leader peptide-binding protein [Corynebacterium breve]|uniref:TOMM leader peptide-binding protein n=1 Tax=Corynebacterium breve TaxID=3049799 RepID=A0ABY8VG69_9CORY|nr:TOMM precursor leader peptide-binding protein [Corynebacterium breve]WIM68307.1 TOMM precursor leader peptide-binding protein [Corynebacterium breve]